MGSGSEIWGVCSSHWLLWDDLFLNGVRYQLYELLSGIITQCANPIYSAWAFAKIAAFT